MSLTHSRLLLLVLLPFVVVSTSGCLYSREIAQTRRDFERQYPDLALKREVVLSLGPGTLGFTRWIAGFMDDEDVRLAVRVLGDVRRVKVGVYRVESGDLDLDAYDMPTLRRLRDWETAARIREEDEVVWVLYREHRGRVEQMFVAVLDDENLVLTRLDGDLQGVLEAVLEEKGHLWHK